MKLPTEISFALLLKILLYYMCKINGKVHVPCIISRTAVDFNALIMYEDDRETELTITRRNNCTVELISPTSVKVFDKHGRPHVLTIVDEDKMQPVVIMDIPEIQS